MQLVMSDATLQRSQKYLVYAFKINNKHSDLQADHIMIACHLRFGIPKMSVCKCFWADVH